MQCEIWCYGDTVIWPALQARAFALVIIFNCAMVLFSGLFFFNSACLIICAVYGVIFHYDRQHALSYVDLIVCKTVRDLLVLG